MPDPQPLTGGWGAEIAGAVAGALAGAGVWFRGRGWRPEATRLRAEDARLAKNVHDLRDHSQAALLRVAVVETGLKAIGERLERIEDKLDRWMERG